MGLFDGWWVGIEDGRPDRASVTVETWDTKLRESGFSGVETVVRDNTHSQLFVNANIISRPAITMSKAERVTLLRSSSRLSDFGKSISTALISLGTEIDHCVWGQEVLPGQQHVVSLIDVEPDRDPLLANIDAPTLDTLIKTIADVSGTIVLWLMPSAQVGCSNPQYGQILGMARCLRAELGVELVTLELDSFDANASYAAAQLLAQQDAARMTRSTLHDDPEVDAEYV
jgi:hypothetical protein